MGIRIAVIKYGFLCFFLIASKTLSAFHSVFLFDQTAEDYQALYRSGAYDELLLAAGTDFLALEASTHTEDYWQHYESLTNAYILNEKWEIAFAMVSKGVESLKAVAAQDMRLIRFMVMKAYLSALLESPASARNWFEQAADRIKQDEADAMTVNFFHLNFAAFLLRLSEYGVVQRIIDSHNDGLTSLQNSLAKNEWSLLIGRLMIAWGEREKATAFLSTISNDELSRQQQEEYFLLTQKLNQTHLDPPQFLHTQLKIEWLLQTEDLIQLEAVIKDWPGTEWLPYFYLKKAEQFHRLKQYDASIDMLEQSLGVIKDNYGMDHILYLNTIEQLAVAYWSSNQWRKSFNYFRRGVDLYQLQYQKHFPLMSERQKEHFYAKNQLFGQKLANFSIENKVNEQEALGLWMNYLIQFKGLLFNYQYDIVLNTAKSQALAQLYKAYLQIRDEVAITHEAKQIGLTVDDQLLDSLNGVLESYERQLSIRSYFHDRANGGANQGVSWQMVRQAIPDATAMLEIIRVAEYDPASLHSVEGSYQYVFLKMDASSRTIQKYVNPIPTVDKYVTAYNHLIHFQINDTLTYGPLFKGAAEALSLHHFKNLIVIPDGQYHMINFNSLYNPKTREYVMDNWNVQVYGNAADLLKRTYQVDKQPRALFMGAPAFATSEVKTKQLQRGSFLNNISLLPGTRDEILSIAQLFESRNLNGKVYLDNEAREDFLKRELDRNSNYSIIHLATHGFFNRYQEDPIRGNDSGLLFTNASSALDSVLILSKYLSIGTDQPIEDDVLKAAEVGNFNLLGADLVVLSACETGLGTVRDGEGVYGLHRAFQSAGAQQVIMSLWKVDDLATRVFMESFYDGWLSGDDMQSAFKTAQLTTRSQYPHPKYWAAFNLIGR